MKKYIIMLSVILASNFLYSQQFPVGTWTIVTDDQGNIIDAKNAGEHHVTSFDFTEGQKYSFLYQEFDVSGRKTIEVIERGVYVISASKFTLNPSTSTTTFFEYIPQSAKPVSNTAKQNPISPAEYNWTYQKEGDVRLIIVALNPGYREGIFSVTKSKAASSRPATKPTPLAQARPAVRSL